MDTATPDSIAVNVLLDCVPCTCCILRLFYYIQYPLIIRRDICFMLYVFYTISTYVAMIVLISHAYNIMRIHIIETNQMKGPKDLRNTKTYVNCEVI